MNNAKNRKRSAKEEKKEEKRRKQIRRIGWRAGWALGIGIGVLIARMIAPLLFGEISDSTHFLFQSGGWSLIFYGVIMLAGLMFIRKHAQKINLIMSYIVMPALVILIILEYQGA